VAVCSSETSVDFKLTGSIMVKALCDKAEGRGFQARWGECIFFFSPFLSFPICLILPAALGPGVYSTSNRNEYQKQKNNVFCQ
jgi:hypothetical protein